MRDSINRARLLIDSEQERARARCHSWRMRERKSEKMRILLVESCPKRATEFRLKQAKEEELLDSMSRLLRSLDRGYYDSQTGVFRRGTRVSRVARLNGFLTFVACALARGGRECSSGLVSVRAKKYVYSFRQLHATTCREGWGGGCARVRPPLRADFFEQAGIDFRLTRLLTR